MQIESVLDVETNTITIKQRIDYLNTSKDRLKELYFNDWISSYSSPTTPLANRFVEEFNNYLLLSVPTRFIRDWITCSSLYTDINIIF